MYSYRVMVGVANVNRIRGNPELKIKSDLGVRFVVYIHGKPFCSELAWGVCVVVVVVTVFTWYQWLLLVMLFW